MILLTIKKVCLFIVEKYDSHLYFYIVVYGVNTGFGSFASTIIPDDKLA
jgi:histidine ammonia-lyase